MTLNFKHYSTHLLILWFQDSTGLVENYWPPEIPPWHPEFLRLWGLPCSLLGRWFKFHRLFYPTKQTLIFRNIQICKYTVNMSFCNVLPICSAWTGQHTIFWCTSRGCLLIIGESVGEQKSKKQTELWVNHAVSLAQKCKVIGLGGFP